MHGAVSLMFWLFTKKWGKEPKKPKYPVPQNHRDHRAAVRGKVFGLKIGVFTKKWGEVKNGFKFHK